MVFELLFYFSRKNNIIVCVYQNKIKGTKSFLNYTKLEIGRGQKSGHV